MGWRRHSGRVTLESSHKWAENCLMCEELAPTQMWLYLHRNWTPFLSLLYGFGRCFWCFHTIYTPSPRAEPEETPNFSSTFPLHFSEITQIYKLSRRQWQWYKNWHRLLHEDSSSSSSLHFNSAKMTNKNKAMANGLKNGPWIHPGKRCIKATCISAFLVFKQNKNCFSRQRDERQRCRAAGGRSGGFDGGFRSFTHSLCCIWKEGQLVMRKCKDLLKRYVYSILCVLLHLVSYLLFFCFYSFILKIALQDFIPAFEIIHLLTSVKLQPRLCVDTFNTIFFVFDGKTFLKETGLEWLTRRFVEAGNNMNRW